MKASARSHLSSGLFKVTPFCHFDSLPFVDWYYTYGMLELAPAAFLAGILMFLAPCTLPIVPGYLAFISATPEGALLGRDRRRLLVNALAFVLGFSIIFILLGLFAGWVGSTLGEWRYVIGRVAGAVLILFGITMLGRFALPVLSRDFRLSLPKWLSLGRPESSLLIGALFALGWSPCIGPILGSILFLASSSATASSGAILLGVFSLGLALPFLACALLINYASTALGRLAIFSQWLQILGGMVLIVLGVMMLLGQMGMLIGWGNVLFGFMQYDKLLNHL